jgi:group I intron endonuclease
MDTYRATNTIDGKFYIGSSKNFNQRKEQHLNSRKNLPFQNALRKNPEAFEWEVWSDDSDEPVLEQALLDMWFGKECCYNLNPYADRPSPTFEQLSKSGKQHVERKTALFDPSNKDKVLEGAVKSGKKAVENKTGIHDPSNAQIVEETRRKNHQNQSKPVMCLETSVVYLSSSEAEASTGIDASSIRKCVKGKRKTAGGFKWVDAKSEGKS